MIRLIANEAFTYDGRDVATDEEFDACDRDVAILTRAIQPRAKVLPARDMVTKEETAGGADDEEASKSDADASELFSGEAEPQGRRGKYNRRDMRAKD